jgi:large subunit ribosomal protein L22
MTETVAAGKAKLMNARISPKKVGPVLELTRKRSLKDAMVKLAFDSSKGAKLLLKLLKSARANAETTKKSRFEDLYISEIWVGEGRKIKSGEFVGRGRFNPILKRSSNIYVSLEERKK